MKTNAAVKGEADMVKSMKDQAEELISRFPPAEMRGKSIATQLRNYTEALDVQSRPPTTADENDVGPVRVLDMAMPAPKGRPALRKASVRPVDASGKLPLLPFNRKLARMTAGFTLQEVALAAGTTVTTAKVYEENRATIRRNDKRQALDDVYRMFLEASQ